MEGLVCQTIIYSPHTRSGSPIRGAALFLLLSLLAQGPHTAGAYGKLFSALGRIDVHGMQIGFDFFRLSPIDVHSVMGHLVSENRGFPADFTAQKRLPSFFFRQNSREAASSSPVYPA